MNRPAGSADSRVPDGTVQPESSGRSPALLLREVIGRLLRVRRVALGLTLAQVAARAGISTQYLSEVERGLKDASSEMIAAIAGAVGLELHEVLVLSSQMIAPRSSAALSAQHLSVSSASSVPASAAPAPQAIPRGTFVLAA
jgi:transcriptional regulator with XRE-family HTH domain